MSKLTYHLRLVKVGLERLELRRIRAALVFAHKSCFASVRPSVRPSVKTKVPQRRQGMKTETKFCTYATWETRIAH